jgi:hypothetical protein
MNNRFIRQFKSRLFPSNNALCRLIVFVSHHICHVANSSHPIAPLSNPIPEARRSRLPVLIVGEGLSAVLLAHALTTAGVYCILFTPQEPQLYSGDQVVSIHSALRSFTSLIHTPWIVPPLYSKALAVQSTPTYPTYQFFLDLLTGHADRLYATEFEQTVRTTMQSIRAQTLENHSNLSVIPGLEFEHFAFARTDDSFVDFGAHHVIAYFSRNTKTTTTADPLSFKGSIIIGADGPQSRVRRAMLCSADMDDGIKPAWAMLTITTTVLHALISFLVDPPHVVLHGLERRSGCYVAVNVLESPSEDPIPVPLYTVQITLTFPRTSPMYEKSCLGPESQLEIINEVALGCFKELQQLLQFVTCLAQHKDIGLRFSEIGPRPLLCSDPTNRRIILVGNAARPMYVWADF